jgi:site-specific DNA-adenine methylase
MAVISYFGGKSSKAFREFINIRIPKDGIKTYVEPFSGSMGTYMDDPDLNFENVIYNDMNKHQVNLYKCSQNPEEFIPYLENLRNTTLAINENADVTVKWDFYKEIYKENINNDFLDDMNFEIGDYEKAAMYAFLIMSSFSSVYPRGGGFSGYKKKNDRLRYDIFVDKIKNGKYTDKLKSITEFHNIDFEELINMYDAEDTYLYLDPPYARFSEETGEDDAKRLFWYGSDDEGVFGPASHRRLIELIKNSKCRWSLSYYYFPLLEELLPKDEYFWHEKEFHRSSANVKNPKNENKKGRELLITNYNPETGEKI